MRVSKVAPPANLCESQDSVLAYARLVEAELAKDVEEAGAMFEALLTALPPYTQLAPTVQAVYTDLFVEVMRHNDATLCPPKQ